MSSPVTVTATVFDPGNNLLQGNAFVRFRLRNFDGLVPIVSGTGVFAETQIDAFPNASGAVSQTLWGNNHINGNTYYTVEFHNNGRITSSGNYNISGSTNLNTAATISPSPVPSGPNTIIFQNNGAMNSSQTTLNLENTDGSLTITDVGGGTLNLQAVSNPYTYVNRIGFTASGLAVNSATCTSGCNLGMACNFVNVALSTYPTGYLASSTNPSYVDVISASSTESGGFTDQQLNIALGNLQDWLTKIEINGSAGGRYWFGISDQLQSAVETVFNSDTPAAHFVGFRYDTNTDTHYQAVCQTSSSNQTVVDTGITPSAVHTLEFRPSGSSILFYIQGILVATISTHIPTASTAMATLEVADGNSTDSFHFYYVSALLNS